VNSGPTPTGTPNQYTVTYTVTVTNTGGTDGSYGLTDTPAFGVGTTLNGSSCTPSGTGAASCAGVTGTTTPWIVAPAPTAILIGGSHSYAITVTFTIDPATVTIAGSDCSLATGSNTNTGLLNHATLTPTGGSSITQDACAPLPPNILHTKTVSSGPTPTGTPNQYTITYTVAVTNTGGTASSYGLTDLPAFGIGTTLNAASCVPSGAGAATCAGVTGTSPPWVVAPPLTAIAVGGTHNYAITVTFTVDPASVTVAGSDCSLATGSNTNTGLLNHATLTPTGGVAVTQDACAPLPALVSHNKVVTSGPTPTGTPNQYTITYTITVSNTGGADASYGLTDTPAFGVGTTINGASCTPSGTGAASCVGVTGIITPWVVAPPLTPIVAGGTHNYAITVTFTIDPATVTTVGSDCTTTTGSNTNTGLLNHATLTPTGGSSITKDACAPLPPNILHTKTVFSGPTPTGTPNQYTVTYTVTVSNTGGTDGGYGLTDTPAFGVGTTLVAASCVPSGTGAATCAGVTGTSPPWVVAPAATAITAGAIHSYAITVTFSVDPATVTTAGSDCSLATGSNTNTGLLNHATLTPTGGSAVTQDACVPLPPNLLHTKVVQSGPTPTGTPNQYTITYTVNVTNTGGTDSSYGLTDAPAFGAGTTINGSSCVPSGTGAASCVGVTGANPPWTVAPPPTAITAGGSHSYAITVTFTIDPATVTTVGSDCSLLTGSSTNTGLLNLAIMTPTGGSSVTKSACAPLPPNILHTKTVTTGPTPTGTPNQYTITYTVVVNNTGGTDGGYGLTDTPAFGVGTTLNASSCVPSGTGAASCVGVTGTNPPWTVAPAPTAIVAGGSHSYAITVTFTVDPATVTVAGSDCSLQTGSNTNTGLLNHATLTPTGGSSVTQDACAPLPPNLLHTKTVTTAPTATGTPNQYNITYTVVVTNTGGTVGSYALSDTPAFGVGTTLNASSCVPSGAGAASCAGVTGTNPPWVVAPANTSIAIGGSHSYAITVTFTVAPAQTTVDGSDCSLATGSNTNTGLLNHATLTPTGGTAVTQDACAPIPGSISHTKQVTSGPTPTGTPNQYTVTYTINVINPGGTAGSYLLTDTPAFGVGTTINGASCVPSGSGAATCAGVTGTSTPWTVAPANTAIAAGGSHSYAITVTFTVDPATVTTVGSDCSLQTGSNTNTGLLNHATLTPTGGTAVVQDACAPLPPNILHTKGVTSGPTPTGTPNQYTVTYTISVTNTGGTTGGYGLVDNPAYGVGTTINQSTCTPSGTGAASCAGVTGPNPPWTVAAANTQILAGGSHSYQITVTFTVDPATVTVVGSDCSLQTGSNTNTGLLNHATITPTGGSSITQDACVPIPPNIQHTKVVTSGPTATANPNQYSITYTINVTNNGGTVGSYTLTDTPAFGVGTTINGSSCVPSGAGAATCAGVTGANPPWTVAPANTSIAIGGSHSYAITVTFTVNPAQVTADGNDCLLNTGSNTNTGLLNHGTLTPTGGTAVVKDACAPIPNITFSFSITKTPSVSIVTPGSPLSFTVVVTNNGPAPADGAIITDPAIPFYTVSDPVVCLGTTGNASCPTPLTVAAMQGAGMTVASFPAGATITLRIDGVSSLVNGQLVNTVTVSPPVGVPGVASASASAVVATKVGVIPTLGQNALIALMLLLGFGGAFYLRRARS